MGSTKEEKNQDPLIWAAGERLAERENRKRKELSAESVKIL